MTVRISPGDVYFDALPDGRFERCILRATTPDTPDREAAARGGTGEFFRRLPATGITDERVDAAEMVAFEGAFVFLEREE